MSFGVLGRRTEPGGDVAKRVTGETAAIRGFWSERHSILMFLWTMDSGPC